MNGFNASRKLFYRSESPHLVQLENSLKGGLIRLGKLIVDDLMDAKSQEKFTKEIPNVGDKITVDGETYVCTDKGSIKIKSGPGTA